MIDHGTGVVIGETAVVGKNCSFLHGVTLGSTGKEKGDRHPKIGDDVLIGCNTTVLGNISIGSCCKIGSGSIVLKSLPSGGQSGEGGGQVALSQRIHGHGCGLGACAELPGSCLLDHVEHVCRGRKLRRGDLKVTPAIICSKYPFQYLDAELLFKIVNWYPLSLTSFPFLDY